MNGFVLVLLCAFAVLAKANVEINKENFSKAVRNCQAETKSTDVDVEEMLNQKPASSTPGKCLRNCVMKEFGAIGADNKLLKEPLIAMLKFSADNDAAKEAAAEEIANTCINSVTELPVDACEAAEVNGLCLIKEVKARGFAPLKLS